MSCPIGKPEHAERLVAYCAHKLDLKSAAVLEETLVVGARQAGIGIDDALGAQDVGERRQAPGQVVDGADMVGRQRTAARVVDRRLDESLATH